MKYDYKAEVRQNVITSIYNMKITDLDKEIYVNLGLSEAILEELRNNYSGVFFSEFVFDGDTRECVLSNLPLVTKCVYEVGAYNLKEFGEAIECEQWNELDHMTRQILVESCVDDFVKNKHMCTWHLRKEEA